MVVEIKQEQALVTVQDFNKKFTAAKSTSNVNRIGVAGIVTLVNSEKNGKRIMLGKALMLQLGKPDYLQFSFSDTEIAIGEDLSDDGHSFHVRQVGAKGAIYSAGLVHEMTERFELDFSDKVSMTFYEVRYVDMNEGKVAIITMSDESALEIG